jgi:hypothetical protein
MELYTAGGLRRTCQYQSLLPAVFAAIPVLYTVTKSPLESLFESLLESLRESLLESLRESLLESLLDSLLEGASHWEELSFPWEALGRWKTLSLWMLWLIEGSRSMETLATRGL